MLRNFALAVLSAAALTVAMAAPALAQGPNQSNSITVTAPVSESITMSGQASFSFPATVPGGSQTVTAAEAYTVSTNDLLGYTLNLNTGSSQMVTIPTNATPIPNTALAVTETATAPQTIHFTATGGGSRSTRPAPPPPAAAMRTAKTGRSPSLRARCPGATPNPSPTSRWRTDMRARPMAAGALAVITAASAPGAHHSPFSETVSPAKAAARPGHSRMVTVWDTGKIPLAVSVSLDEIRRIRGTCRFTAAPAWATVAPAAITLRPGQGHAARVRIAPHPPAGRHDVAVLFTTDLGRHGAVRVRGAVAAQLAVYVPGKVAHPVKPCFSLPPPDRPGGLPPWTSAVLSLAAGAALLAMWWAILKRSHSRRPATPQ